MNLFASLELGRRALFASRTALDVAGNNIANVNTPGYSRRRLELAEQPPMHLGRLFLGTGVAVDRVVRVVDGLLHAQLRSEEEVVGRHGAASAGLEQVESILGEASAGGIGDSLSGFFAAFSSLAATPDDASLRRNAASRGETLAASIRDRAAQLLEFRRRTDAAVTDTVEQISLLTRDIAQLNRQIQISEPGAVEASDLRDTRSRKLRELSGLVDIQVSEGPRGSAFVSLAGTGDSLVVDDAVRDLTVTRDADGMSRIQVTRGGSLVDLTDTLRGGKLGALLHVRDDVAKGYLSQLDALASDLISRVNAAHAGGTDGHGNAGGAFFTPTPAGASAAATLTVSGAIVSDPSLIAAGASASVGDGSNALAIAALERQTSAGLGGLTSSGYLADVQTRLGLETRSASSAFETGRAALLAAEERLQAISGVDLDEEATALLQYQRSYEAAAKFIAVVNEMTRTAIEALSR